MKNKLFKIVANFKEYELFEKILELFDAEKFEIEKSMAIEADDNLTSIMNIVNNAGWDSKESHSRVIDLLRKSSNIYDKYLEE